MVYEQVHTVITNALNTYFYREHALHTVICTHHWVQWIKFQQIGYWFKFQFFEHLGRWTLKALFWWSISVQFLFKMRGYQYIHIFILLSFHVFQFFLYRNMQTANIALKFKPHTHTSFLCLWQYHYKIKNDFFLWFCTKRIKPPFSLRLILKW